MSPSSALVVSVAALLLAGVPQQPALPSWVPVPQGSRVSDVTQETWGEVAIPDAPGVEAVVERGKRLAFTMTTTGVPADADGQAIFAHVRQAWAAQGWTVTRELRSTPFVAVLTRPTDGSHVRAVMTVFDISDIRVDMVEAGPQPLRFDIPTPGSGTSDLSKLQGDIPFLPPLPGSGRIGGGWNDEVLKFRAQGSDELQIIGAGYLGRHYRGPAPGLSNIQFYTVYRDALVKAGWRIVDGRQAVNAGNTWLVAQFTKDDVTFWAYLHADGGEYSIDVAGTRPDDLTRQLQETCRAPLYGVLFEFNKATIRTESEAVLLRAVDALKASGSRTFQVQGHTDDVGTDSYNQTLSEARARSVMQWLVSHGVEAQRLTAKGYGKQQPVASNESDEGRAKNRRVELACAPAPQGF